MSESAATEAVVRHAGFVMAHAAIVVASLEPHELICPFVVVTKGEDREMLEFEAETQDSAVCQAWSSLEENKQHIDLWAMAREGLVATDMGKADVLVVSAWGHGMSEAMVFTQAFQGRGNTFELIGPVELRQQVSANDLRQVRSSFHAGINQHPKAERWWGWANDVQQQVPADVLAAPSGRQGRG